MKYDQHLVNIQDLQKQEICLASKLIFQQGRKAQFLSSLTLYWSYAPKSSGIFYHFHALLPQQQKSQSLILAQFQVHERTHIPKRIGKRTQGQFYHIQSFYTIYLQHKPHIQCQSFLWPHRVQIQILCFCLKIEYQLSLQRNHLKKNLCFGDLKYHSIKCLTFSQQSSKCLRITQCQSTISQKGYLRKEEGSSLSFLNQRVLQLLFQMRKHKRKISKIRELFQQICWFQGHQILLNKLLVGYSCYPFYIYLITERNVDFYSFLSL
ncbi:hypothetical protein TTHERM_000962139 (macronuclear) [Tetrahymena thermophila SB210]|uniref:Uncharacterized protein n=1 Tax=Tetrahymena thermophila (strain SB210) TaxID=312017 RepID=W7XGR3_TETTS|nr:hypothetical protein TTHERM_000962139 [Tetrahymena thermophila SB210]EWS73391.1 hypothetical protein TTHERM_000962139 [Tetrahymena thermophila SB210]|eukprot:XP_012654081.1 hypothetical protein TTHERM_000962139 [Tetrahymena thermophila SB210]